MAKTLATALSLDEFNAKVLEGEILEIWVLRQQIRIFCTWRDRATGHMCGAHLKDLWYADKKEGRATMRVGCQVCREFTGYRYIGASGHINGTA